MFQQPSVERHSRGLGDVKTIVSCALLTALSIILARLIIPMPNEFTRFSLEAAPIFISGMFFGPLAGALVGFSADAIGCLFSLYGYNPIFSVPPILYGLCAGFFRPYLHAKITPARIALAFLPSVVLGSVLWQSFALALVYGGEARQAFFLAQLASRSIQFAITLVLNVLVVWLLYRYKVFSAAKLWLFPNVNGVSVPDQPSCKNQSAEEERRHDA